MMTAALTVARRVRGVGLQPRDAGLLAQARQRVVLTQKRNQRPARPVLGGERRRYSRDALAGPEPGTIRHVLLRGNRVEFLPARLGVVPDMVGQLDEALSPIVHRSRDPLSSGHHRNL